MGVGIVTGASHGIGAAVARRMAEAEHNLVLLAAPGDGEELQAIASDVRRRGVRAVTVAADIADADTAATAVTAAVDEFGGLDWVASVAGVAHFEEDVLDLSLDRFDETFAINVRGTFLLCREAARAMAGRGSGAIVCVASTMSHLAEEGFVSYTASKGAVAQLVRAYAVDLAPYGIRVNALAPGWVYTRATAAEIDDPERWSQGRTRLPMDRPAEPAEIASVVSFLLSDDASYMTGATVVADGGLTAGARYSDWQAVLNTSGPRAARLEEEARDVTRRSS